jgi:hypothetical protein
MTTNEVMIFIFVFFQNVFWATQPKGIKDKLRVFLFSLLLSATLPFRVFTLFAFIDNPKALCEKIGPVAIGNLVGLALFLLICKIGTSSFFWTILACYLLAGTLANSITLMFKLYRHLQKGA